MAIKNKYLLVDSSVLPDVYNKVVKAKSLLAQGKATSSTQAAKLAGISRSAFYKYKDFVFSPTSDENELILTLSVTLTDAPGILSSLIGVFQSMGANILTINQNLPVDSVALVSITARIGSNEDAERIFGEVVSLDGVVGAKEIARNY